MLRKEGYDAVYYVYVLYSLKDKRLYIGYAENIERRIKGHQEGHVKTTQYRGPLKLIYYEAYLLQSDALGREKFLKSGPGHKYLKKQSRRFFEKVNYAST